MKCQAHNAALIMMTCMLQSSALVSLLLPDLHFQDESSIAVMLISGVDQQVHLVPVLILSR